MREIGEEKRGIVGMTTQLEREREREGGGEKRGR